MAELVVKNNEIIVDSSETPVQFFHEKIVEAQTRQHVKLSENVEFYLVNLLCDFLRTKDTEYNEDCLALILKKAIEDSYYDKIKTFKLLGDKALYMAGFYQDFFRSKPFDVKYYLSMGSFAYKSLSGIMKKGSTYNSTMSEIYGEMSEQFHKSVDILLDVSEHTTQKDSPPTLLSLYESWAQTESPKLERDLIKNGITPVRNLKKNIN